MKRIRFVICSGIFLCLALTLSAFSNGKESTRADTSSTCILRNPPNTSVNWRFGGNQVIWVTVENGNILGVTATLTWENFSDTKNWVLLPFQKTDKIRYDVFGHVPIGYRFILSTISDAALLTAQATWDPF